MSVDDTPLWKRAAKKVLPYKAREALRRKAVLMLHSWNSLTTVQNKNRAGINLIGHIRGDFGLGESCRLVAQALQAAQIPFALHNIPLNGPAKEENLTWEAYEQPNLPYGINLVHLNPNEMMGAVKERVLGGRYNIAYWLWELPEFPAEWMYTFKLVDEIWTPSEFVTEALQKYTHKKVCTMPYGFVKPVIEAGCGRNRFGLPEDEFLFLISYDGNSVSERKNPLGAVRAFCEAFPEGIEKVGLVIKATHAREEDIQNIKKWMGKRHTYILTESYPKAVFHSLIQTVDAYVSLHRAEGFGLVMAEAMLLKTPVIATAWSANMEFMNEDVACLIPAKIVELQEDYPPYHKGDHWAAPEEEKAVEYMKLLFENREFGRSMAERAQQYLSEKLTPELSGEKMMQRLQEIKKILGDT